MPAVPPFLQLFIISVSVLSLQECCKSTIMNNICHDVTNQDIELWAIPYKLKMFLFPWLRIEDG